SQPSSARLASSTIEYLANRTQGMDSAGNPLLFHTNDETFTPKTVGTTASTHLAHILGTHMPAIDMALFEEAEGSTAGGMRDEVTRDDLGTLTNLPKFKREDLQVMIRVAASSDEGLATLRTALTRYEDSHLATVVDCHYVGTDQETWRFKGNFESMFETALRNQGKLEAFFIDQIGDQQVTAGRAADERIRAWIGLG
ncbi:hypothetical protein, partial [Schaalia canis]|uniref:hypothetical protein n=1 Tax=Schaalia canis TaxID=100469 RepID=UPI001402B33B